MQTKHRFLSVLTLVLSSALSAAPAAANNEPAHHPAAAQSPRASQRGVRATQRASTAARATRRRARPTRRVAGTQHAERAHEATSDTTTAAGSALGREPSELSQGELDSVVREQGHQRAAMRPTVAAEFAEFIARTGGRVTIEIPDEATHGHVQDQESSGRCWSYAGTKTIEADAFQATGQEMNFSETWIDFHSLQDRSFESLEGAIEAALDGENTYEVDIAEGGSYGHLIATVAKHGLVPQRSEDNTYDATHTDAMIETMKRIVANAFGELQAAPREANGRISSATAQAIRVRAQKNLQHRLRQSFGFDPDKVNAEHGGTKDGLTAAQRLAKKVGFDADNHLVLTNYVAPHLVADSQGLSKGLVKSLNVDMETMEKEVISQLRSGRATYISATVGTSNPDMVPNAGDFPASVKGFISTRLFDRETVSPGSVPTKAALQATSVGGSNHAMAVVGVELDRAGNPLYWKIENSWGEDAGQQGHYYMDAAAFRLYVTRTGMMRNTMTPAMQAHVRDLESQKSPPVQWTNN